jgi:hypothetical protein
MHLLLTLLLAQAMTAIDVSKITVSTPTTLTVVDVDKIDGDPWRLAWSPDGTQLHLAAIKRKGTQLQQTDWVIDLQSPTAKPAAPLPEWATKYWEWKSWKSAPGNAAFEIGLDQQRKNVSATARPMGGDLARGGASVSPGTSVEEAAGGTSTNLLVITMTLKGEIIGRWEGEPMVPGMTFGWGPQGSDMMAFAGQDGKLALVDLQGRKQKINGTKDVRLPAWSVDAARLAWVEKQDKKKFRIQIANVSQASTAIQ